MKLIMTVSNAKQFTGLTNLVSATRDLCNREHSYERDFKEQGIIIPNHDCIYKEQMETEKVVIHVHVLSTTVAHKTNNKKWKQAF